MSRQDPNASTSSRPFRTVIAAAFLGCSLLLGPADISAQDMDAILAATGEDHVTYLTGFDTRDTSVTIHGSAHPTCGNRDQGVRTFVFAYEGSAEEVVIDVRSDVPVTVGISTAPVGIPADEAVWAAGPCGQETEYGATVRVPSLGSEARIAVHIVALGDVEQAEAIVRITEGS